jgi:translation initiation factor 2 subunit 2
MGRPVSPMTAQDYESMLERARKNLPTTAQSQTERWALPEVDVMYEGKTTVVKNFAEIVEAVRREEDHILGQVLRELGSAGSQDGRRLILKSMITKEKLNDKFRSYVDTFVICVECGKPDTHLIKEGRIQVVECMACGAKRPVKVKKGLKSQDRRSAFIPGDELEVLIQDVGKMGDGVAKIDRYVIFVPGVTKGVRVKIRIEKVSGTTVIGRVVQQS